MRDIPKVCRGLAVILGVIGFLGSFFQAFDYASTQSSFGEFSFITFLVTLLISLIFVILFVVLLYALGEIVDSLLTIKNRVESIEQKLDLGQKSLNDTKNKVPKSNNVPLVSYRKTTNSNEDSSGWRCPTCDKLNHTVSSICKACGAYRY